MNDLSDIPVPKHIGKKELNMNLDVDLNKIPDSYLITFIILFIIVLIPTVILGFKYLNFKEREAGMKYGCELLAITPDGPYFFTKCQREDENKL